MFLDRRNYQCKCKPITFLGHKPVSLKFRFNEMCLVNIHQKQNAILPIGQSEGKDESKMTKMRDGVAV